MQLLESLGINHTFWLYLIIFLITFVAMKLLVFNRYVEAYKDREKCRTHNEELATRLTQETEDLHVQFEETTKQMGQEYRTIFDQLRIQTMRDHDQLVGEAKAYASQTIEQTRQNLEKEVTRDKEILQAEIPEVSKNIIKKLMDKGI